MNKLLIFDLDGVLIDSNELHYISFNSVLSEVDKKYEISREENVKIYNGLDTNSKLELLAINKGLPREYFDKIWNKKQNITFDFIKQIPRDEKLIEICKNLKQLDYKISVATNSIRESAKLALISTGILEYVDLWVTSQDVSRPKPYPEVYWQCMIKLNALPKNTIIVEDSSVGRQGALASGANLCAVEDTWDVTWDKIFKKIQEVEKR
jgi:HAD superfamily hydrolase (TIGR01509 family)